MFGGAGIYCDGRVFAFVDDDALFFKTDEPGRAAFEAEGLGPFTYMTKHGPGTLNSYWRAPERLLDDRDEMLEWAGRALAVAGRATAGARKSPRPQAKKQTSVKSSKAAAAANASGGAKKAKSPRGKASRKRSAPPVKKSAPGKNLRGR